MGARSFTLGLAFAATTASVMLGPLESDAFAQAFTNAPPGELVSGSGSGRKDTKVYAPAMAFPFEAGPAYANSQVWGVGGSQGPAGAQSDKRNFAYPWRDNYCESRTYDMPLCPGGQGHQGQDIRGATAEKDKYWCVAVSDGTITSVGSYSVYLTAPDGTRFDYLHMGKLQVKVGTKVKRGQRIGMVSNEFGGTPTTVHMHFNIRQNVAGIGSVYVPPYMSLVTSYKALLAPPKPPADAGARPDAMADAMAPQVPSFPAGGDDGLSDDKEIATATLSGEGDAEAGCSVARRLAPAGDVVGALGLALAALLVARRRRR